MNPRNLSRKPLVLAMSFSFAAAPVWAQESTTEAVNVDVTATRYDTDAVVKGKALNIQRAANVDTATLMTNVSGVAFQVGGAVSSIPVIRGLADDRISVLVDGVDALVHWHLRYVKQRRFAVVHCRVNWPLKQFNHFTHKMPFI